MRANVPPRSSRLRAALAVTGAMAFAVGCTQIAGIGDFDEVDDPAPDADETSRDGGVDAPVEAAVADDATDDTANDGGIVSFVGATHASVADGDLLTLILSTPPLPGDFMWLAVYTDVADTPLDLNGWTLFADRPNTTRDYHSRWLYRVALAGDPATYTMSFGRPALAGAALAVYRGVDTQTPLTAAVTADVTGNAFASPPFTTLRPAARVVVSYLLDEGDAVTWTAPVDATERARETQALLVDFLVDQPGPVASRVAVYTVDGGASATGAACVMALYPAR